MITRDERMYAEREITRLIYTYCQRLDAADFEATAEFLEHAIWHFSPETSLHGRDEKRGWLRDNLQVHSDGLGTRHMVTNVLVDVADDGQTASAVSYVHLTQVTEGFPLQLLSQARYDDRFALVPRVEAVDAERFEVPGVPGDDGHLGGLGDGSDECVVEWGVFGDSVGGQDPCGSQVERQHPVGEGRQNVVFEPAAQDLALEPVGAFLRDHAAFDLGHRRRRHELIGYRY